MLGNAAHYIEKGHYMNYLKDNEIRTKLKVVLVEMPCPKCNNGYLEYVGKRYVYGDEENNHRCNNDKCYHETTLGSYVKYPYKEYSKMESQTI